MLYPCLCGGTEIDFHYFYSDSEVKNIMMATQDSEGGEEFGKKIANVTRNVGSAGDNITPPPLRGRNVCFERWLNLFQHVILCQGDSYHGFIVGALECCGRKKIS